VLLVACCLLLFVHCSVAGAERMPRLERVRFNNNDDGVGGDEDIFVYTGGDQEVPRDVKRVRIAENVDTIPARTFQHCEQLIEVVGHDKLKKIEPRAFDNCPSLRSVTKMSGVVEIEDYAFCNCHALSDIDFDKLEYTGNGAFFGCKSLISVNMSSMRIVGPGAFQHCTALTDVVFGQNLERIERGGAAFYGCPSLTRIVIPLKDNLIIDTNAFNFCNNLSRIDALDGGIHNTISSLHMEQWRHEMEEEIDRINQTLPNIIAIDKAGATQEWITRVLQRMEHYKSEHQIILKEAMTLLELALWKANLHDNEADDAAAAQEGVRVTRGRVKRARKDRCITSGASIVVKNVLPFLALN
jgi:hypothetical protein